MTNKLFGMLALLLASCASQVPQPPRTSTTLDAPDAYTLVSERNLFSGYPATNPDGTLNVIVEIPAGTNAKWEVDKQGVLRWEFKNGEPRVVRFLGYPGNYGMIPSTLLPKEEGGDGDALDVIVLGPPVERGQVVRARIIGVLELMDGGEQDDKLVAVLEGAPLASVQDIYQLKTDFPGVSLILETWFTSYKGPGKMQSNGFRGRADALAILQAAQSAFQLIWLRK